MKKYTDIELLALQYSKLMKEELTAEELADCIAKNKTEEYTKGGYCATHEYTDSNQLLLDAFEQVFHREFSFDNVSDMLLSTNAVELAKQNDFYP